MQLHSFIDSFIFAVKSDDIEQDLRDLDDIMDFSTYSENHSLFNDEFKSQLGRFKNESPLGEIVEACAIRSKVYALRIDMGEEEEEMKRCK